MESIVVSVIDSDGGAGTTSTSIRVNNVAPTSLFIPGPANANDQFITLLAQAIDPSIEDRANLHYDWTISDGILTQGFVNAGNAFTFDRSQFSGVITVTLITSDDDGGSNTFVSAMVFGSSAPETIPITNASFPSSVSVLTVLSLGGSDVIDASGITNPNLRVILDGGLDADQLFGGAGDDIFILRGGNDTANNATSSMGQAGFDQYFLTPNSVLTIYDNSLEGNALNFSTADFAAVGNARYRHHL